VFGGYGPRLFNKRGNNQVKNVIDLLRKKPSSRRATMQIFDADDLGVPRVEIPCTTTLQLLLRDGLLHMIVTMRSNDAYKGLPHDVFCFTMLQELLARSLGADLGIYRHFVGSMHLYDTDFSEAEAFLSEGIQARVEMPPMPEGDPWPAVKRLLEVEYQIRAARDVKAEVWDMAPYWADLVRLLQVLAASGDKQRIDDLTAAMSFERYEMYIVPRKDLKQRAPYNPTEPQLDF
jgi:thymidylate synthase